MIRQLIGERAFLLLVAQRYKHIFCAVFAVSAMLLISNQPAMAQFSIINVKNAPYNAQGDGVTDDSAAIQAAVNAASARPGSTVYFPIGTYFHSAAINVTTNRTTLRGQNRAQTVLTGAAFNLTGPGLNMSQLTTTATNPTAFSSASKVGISNCSFANIVELVNTEDIQVNNCEFNTGAAVGFRITSCNRVSVDTCNFIGTSSTPALFVHTFSNDVAVRRSTFSFNSGYAINLALGNRILIESCTLRNSAFGYGLVGGFVDGLTVRGSNFASTQGGNLGTGISVIQSNNMLFSGNKFSHNDYSVFVSFSSNVQVVSNNISDCNYGPIMQTNTGVLVATNGIYRIQLFGIYCECGPGTQTIQQNTLRDCGLSGAPSAIYVSAAGGANQALIQQNLYTGSPYMAYYIRCELPAPPAVVRGNITTTMLPTLVGP